jgi:hypothetical protein
MSSSPHLPSDLRDQLEGLQREAAALKQDLDRLTNERRDAEAAAMSAVHNGDDAAARDALRHEQRCVESAALVATELQMLELMIGGYADVLAAIDVADHGLAPSQTRGTDESPREKGELPAGVAEMRRPLKPPLPPRPANGES